MESETNFTFRHDTTSPESPLVKAFHHSVGIKDRVAAFARDLSLAHRALKNELMMHSAPGGIGEVLLWSESIEGTVQNCVDDLRTLSASLADEITARQNLELKLRESMARAEKHFHLAFHDAATGLANRTLFSDRLQQALAQARRYRRRVAVLFVDINNFKNINDTYGHDTGDSVLQMVAKRLQGRVRGTDTVSRMGGDEFVCLLTEVKEKAAIAQIADSLNGAISEPSSFNGVDIIVKVSIGVAIGPQDGVTADTLIKNADSAMYQAKLKKSTGCLFFNRTLVGEL